MPTTLPEWAPVAFTQTARGKGGRMTIAISLSSPVTALCLAFRNKYAAVLSVRAHIKGAWTMCLRDHVLMPCAHVEDGGQSTVVLTSDMFSTFGPTSALELVLLQPSPHWLSFGITDLRVFGPATAPAAAATPASVRDASQLLAAQHALQEALAAARCAVAPNPWMGQIEISAVAIEDGKSK